MEEALEARLARLAARFDAGNGEGEALTAQALERLTYRQRHSGKTCDQCHETKPLSAFGVSARERTGLNRTCKQCRNSYERARLHADLL